ncbi:MAG: Mini-ribonuclease 3 [Clostridia bacterium]|nr:Mini-ribonuclease 3 [Clostridia bacterium]
MNGENRRTPMPSVMALAYLGDARHALYVRRMLVLRGISKSRELNDAALDYVTAEAQARAYGRIEKMLTDGERDVFRRAFNSSHLNKPKHASGRDYRTATGFEALIGLLEWLADGERIEFLLNEAYKEDKENDTED